VASNPGLLFHVTVTALFLLANYFKVNFSIFCKCIHFKISHQLNGTTTHLRDGWKATSNREYFRL